jgi:hypothetical protein
VLSAGLEARKRLREKYPNADIKASGKIAKAYVDEFNELRKELMEVGCGSRLRRSLFALHGRTAGS